MNYTSKIASLLRTSEDVVLDLEKKMNAITGKSGVLEKIARENEERVKRTLKNLKIDIYTNKPIASQVFHALIEQARETDSLLFNHFYKPLYSTEMGCKTLIHAVSELTGNLEGFYLKEEKARDFLRVNPPKNIMDSLGYGSDIDHMLEKEDVFEIFSALRFVEDSRWLNDIFFKAYGDLTSDDFEKRPIKAMVLPERWLGIGKEFLGKKLHHMSHLKELGVVFIIPVEEQSPGDVLYLFFMTLHYIYEVDWHAHLFERYSQERKSSQEFANKLIEALKVEVSGDPLPNHGKMSWRLISKYLAKKDTNDPRLFEPHINTEAWHFYNASKIIDSFSKRFPKVGLDFWEGLSVIGEYFPTDKTEKENVLISFDLFDAGISLLQQIGFESKYLYHQQEALWNKIFMEYIGEEEMNKLMMANSAEGFIIL
ncbi:MAG: hypothetical protein ABH887_00550 [bacterium]